MRNWRIAIIWTFACLMFMVVGLAAQTKPAGKSITVYQDPG